MGPATTHTQESALRLDTAIRAASDLTICQVEGLKRIRDRGPGAWCGGMGRAGGAVSRMFDRMAREGLCTYAPHKITPFGRRVLIAFDERARR